MQNKTELAVFSKLGEIFSNISFNSNGLEGVGMSFSGTSAEFKQLAELLEVPTPTATKLKEIPDTLTITDVDWVEDLVTASLEDGMLWITTVDSGEENTVQLSCKDAKELAAFLTVKADEMLGKDVAEIKQEQPIVRRDSLGAESIGRKYRVIESSDWDFPLGCAVIGVHGGNPDGEVFQKLSDSSKKYMYPETLLQEITEDGVIS